MPLFYVVDKHIYYAEALFEAAGERVFQGVGYDESESFRLALFLERQAISIDVAPENAPQFLQFAKAYAEQAPKPVIAVLWKRCVFANKIDVLHALDPAHIGMLYTLPPQQGNYTSDFFPFVEAHLGLLEEHSISVREVVLTPANDDAKCINPFFEASATETLFLAAMVGSALAFDPGDTYEGEFALASKFHSTIVTISNAIKQTLFTPEADLQTIGGVFETNFVSRDGDLFLGHTPLPTVVGTDDTAYVLVFVFLGAEKAFPSSVSILDSISILENYSNVNIIEIDIDETEPFLRDVNFQVFAYEYNTITPSSGALGDSKANRKHMAVCTTSEFSWIDRSEVVDYDTPLDINGLTVYSDARVVYEADPDEEIDDLRSRRSEYEDRCLRFIRVNDASEDFETVIYSDLYDTGPTRISDAVKAAFVARTERPMMASTMLLNNEIDDNEFDQDGDFNNSGSEPPASNEEAAGNDTNGNVGVTESEPIFSSDDESAQPIMTRSRFRAAQGIAFRTRGRTNGNDTTYNAGIN